MKKLLILVFLLIQLPVLADIEYGYNAYGDYVPMSVDGEDVRYGYNAYGDYVPMGIGDDDITYKHNSFGKYVPLSVGDDDIDYGFNAVGDFVPLSIGEDKIQYGYNAQGNYVPVSVDDTKIRYGYNAQGNYVPVKIDKKQTVKVGNRTYTKSELDIVDEELKKFFEFEIEADKLHLCTQLFIENMLMFCKEHKLAKPKNYKEATYLIRVMAMTFREENKK